MNTHEFWMSGGLRRPLLAGGRALGYAAALSALLGWGWVERVSAEVEHASFTLGARLANELGDVVAEPQPITVNGQRLWVASRTTPLSVSDALDRFDASCSSAARALSSELDGLTAPIGAGPNGAQSVLTGTGERALIRRSEAPGRGGQLVCLAPSEPLTGFTDLGERLGALFATGELAPFGELRYVQARPRPEGGSHIVSVWSAGAFNLFEALPRDSDAPGDDPARAPRPPESIRILSANIPGRSQAIRSYTSQRTAEELSAFYASEMPKLGWTLLDAERLVPETAALSPRARAYSLGDAVTFVVVDDTEGAASARATATLVQVGAPGAASAGSPDALR